MDSFVKKLNHQEKRQLLDALQSVSMEVLDTTRDKGKDDKTFQDNKKQLIRKKDELSVKQKNLDNLTTAIDILEKHNGSDIPMDLFKNLLYKLKIELSGEVDKIKGIISNLEKKIASYEVSAKVNSQLLGLAEKLINNLVETNGR
jgi:hypothetical protein